MNRFALIVLCVLGSLITTSSTFMRAPQRVLYCGFSLKSGYSNTPRQYVVRQAKENDISGVPIVVNRIKKELQFDTPIDVFISASENNCYATIKPDGKRMIVADQRFLIELNRVSTTKWAAISVIAHEVGHHVSNFSRSSSQLQGELDADYWSGYVLNKLGSSADAATKCILAYGSEEDSDSHPNKYTRAENIRMGWNDAKQGEIDYSRCEGCEP